MVIYCPGSSAVERLSCNPSGGVPPKGLNPKQPPIKGLLERKQEAPSSILGWGYLFNVVDICDRAWAGYCFSLFCSTAESLQSLDSALANRAPQTVRIEGLTIGTDGGCQYTSKRFEAALSHGGMGHKVSRKNTPEDNAIVEAFHKSVKTEYI